MLKAESARASCSGPCPLAFQVPTKMGTLQLLWVTCSGVWPPSQREWLGETEGKDHFLWTTGRTLSNVAHDYRFATRAHCWFMFTSVSTRSSRSFSAKLFSSFLDSSVYRCLGLLFFRCRTCTTSQNYWPQYQPLRYIMSDWPPAGLHSAAHNFWHWHFIQFSV